MRSEACVVRGGSLTRWSKMLIPTRREIPSEELPGSLSLLLRAGYVMSRHQGVAAYLPLGQRCLLKMRELVRRRLTEAGAQEFLLPGGHVAGGRSSAGPGPESGTTAQTSPSSAFAGPYGTFGEIASSHLRSYKELPQTWFLFDCPSSGGSASLAVRCCYVAVDEVAEGKDPDPAEQALSRVIEACGLSTTVCLGPPELGRETESREHVSLAPEGEMTIAVCPCGYSANLECATSRSAASDGDVSSPAPGQPQAVETPDKRTVAAVAEFLGVPESSVIKSLLYIVAGEPVLALVQGDDQLNQSLLCQAVGTTDIRAADLEEIIATLGAEPGSIGPVGASHVRILADCTLRGRRDMVCGANKDDYHLTAVQVERDFRAEYFDLRQVRAGDPCPRCGKPLAIERGHLLMRSSRLERGTVSAVSPGVLGADNRFRELSLSAHTLHLDRLLFGVVEGASDENGIVLSPEIAPCDVVVTPIRYGDETQRDVCDRIVNALVEAGADVLLDDRDCSPGVKFKDADLIGIRVRITVGPKKLKEGKAEIRLRKTGERLDLPVEEVAQWVVERLIS